MVSAAIKGILTSADFSESVVALILQALDWSSDSPLSQLDTTVVPSRVAAACHPSVNCIIDFTRNDYVVSLAVLSALALSDHPDTSSQAQSLLLSYLARLPDKRCSLSPAQERTLSFAIGNIVSNKALFSTPNIAAESRHTSMGFAEHLLRAGSRASVSDVIGSYAQQQQQQQNTGRQAAGGESSTNLLTTDDVAKAIALIASTISSDDDWRPGDVAAGVNHCCPSLNWEDIIYRLPYSGLTVQQEVGAVFVVHVFLAATSGQNRPFPYSFMYEVWPEPQAQVSFLRCALSSAKLAPHLVDKHMPVVLPDPLETLYHVYHSEFARIISSPWNSLSLVLVLSHLLDSKAADDARALLDHGISREPLLVTLALARLKVQHPRLQALLQHNVVRFLRREFGSAALFFELFRLCEKKIMVSFFCNLQRKDPVFLRRILGVLIDLGIINELLLMPKREDVMMLDFTVELAVFAARRGYLAFDSWFPGLLAELGSDMLHASLEILHTKLQLEAARQRGEDGGVNAYSSAELTTMFKALGTINMSPNNAANLKALYTQFLELTTELELAENEHSADEGRIEKDAESLFLSLYRGELSVDKMVDTLEDLHDSLKVYMRKTYAHVIQYPLEEFAFFDNYPDKELMITGQLVGALIQRHMLSPSSEPAILDMLVRALQSPTTSKSYRFGMTALEACQARIEQLPVFCSAIYQIPAIRKNNTTPVAQLVKSIISSALPQRSGRAADALAGDHAGLAAAGMTARALAHARDDSPSVLATGFGFHSVKPSPLPVIDEPYAEPSEGAKDKIQFAVNNLAPNNLADKTGEVDKVLLPKHFVWFSQEIIVKRASQEPNYHSLYLLFIDALNRPVLAKCILRETLASIARLLNAESTISSSRDRGYLKNLGAWLGGITLARNQPILRENISFKELLCEGFSGNRLIVAIPFVCKVLEQAARSTIFHPPSPWLMSIMAVLSELYATANLKLNLTFEIEVLCKALDLDVKEIAPTSILGSYLARGAVDALGSELSQVSLGGSGAGNSRSSVPAAISASQAEGAAAALSASVVQMPVLSGADISVDILGVLTQHASFQAAEPLFNQQPAMKKMFYMLTERMIREIIPIHVARSIFVAVSCTRDTIQKDFCGEPNEEHVHRAAQVMARGLAGALAVSLCREQLKSKLYLTMREFLIGHSVPEQSSNTIAVGLVADNLDLACAIAEKESIERASQQIDLILSDLYLARKRTRERTGQPFYDIARYSRLAYPADFPEVLKVRLNGLQPGHLRIYEGFTQIPHFFSQIGNGTPGPTVSETPVASIGVTSSTPGSNNESAIASAEFAASASDATGKFNSVQCFERFAAIIADLDKIVSNAEPSVTLSQLPSQHDACLYARDIIILAVRSVSPDDTAMDFAQALVNYLYRSDTRLGIDLYVLLLARMCEMSPRVAKEVTSWLAFADDERKHNVPATIALINEGLVGIEDEDDQLGRLVEANRQTAIDFAARFLRSALLDGAVSTDIRSFSKTIQSFVKLAHSGRAPPIVTHLLEDIQAAQQQQQQQQQQRSTTQAQKSPSGFHPSSSSSSQLCLQSEALSGAKIGPARASSVEPASRSQETASYQHILLNWMRVCNHPAAGEAELTTLVRQLQQQVPLQESAVAAAFFRACVEAAMSFYDQTATASTQPLHEGGSAPPGAAGYQVADALVKLVIYLTKLGRNGNHTDLLPMRMFLSSVALTVVHVHSSSPESFGACQRPLFRLLCSVLHETNPAYQGEEAWCTVECLRAITGLLGETLLLLSPSFVPGFNYVWLMLVSHRHFFPRLVESKETWPLAAALLESQLVFLQPFIASGQASESLKLLYHGVVCVILVVLHDFPEFLAGYALLLCDSIPANCVQLRNLLLSAYPREMRLPEPLTPNLKIDLLPDVSRSPDISFEYAAVLDREHLKSSLERFLVTQDPALFVGDAVGKLFAIGPTTAHPSGTWTFAARYNVGLINAFVLHTVVTITSISDSAARESAQRVALDMLKAILAEADPEACYLTVSAISNQLRFPSSHTYLCSRMILALFSKSEERVRECIARVLIERILVNRPFPWGLLVTLIELLRNPYYAFWSHEFTQRSSQIVEILSAVAKSIHSAGGVASHGQATQALAQSPS
ncbi:CCR4-NOT core subunit cdc39 [Coemansia sp. BCRC 34301]|nr:CCR4-NOT core subunit cdc39 [Coemansia sp. BCRC 34301]